MGLGYRLAKDKGEEEERETQRGAAVGKKEKREKNGVGLVRVCETGIITGI